MSGEGDDFVEIAARAVEMRTTTILFVYYSFQDKIWNVRRHLQMILKFMSFYYFLQQPLL